MFKTYQSNSLRKLAQHFAEIFETDSINPLNPAWIIAQNNEIKEWLSLAFADQNQIAGNFRFIFPSEFLWTLYRLKKKDIPPVLPGDLNALQWALFELFSKNPAFLDEIPFYDTDTDDLKKRFQFCTQLADNFDQYQVYRPQMMEQWLKGEVVTNNKNEYWQAAVWRQLNKDWQSSSSTKDIPRRSQAFTELMQWFENKDPIWEDIPEQIYVFGLSNTPKPFLEIISKIGNRRNIHFFTTKPENIYESVSTDFSALLQKWCEPIWKQTELLNTLQEKNKTQNSSKHIPTEGANLVPQFKVHSCHNKRREVEVLKDEVLRFLDQTPDCQTKDILIMIPDAESYAGILETIFTQDKGEPSLPISRLRRNNQHDVLQALAELLELLSSSFKASSVVQFMNLEAVKTQFSFTDSDLDLIEQWMLDNKIHWGIGKDFNTTYSWQKGLNQLFSGFVMQADALGVYKGLVPFSGISSSDEVKLSARFSRFIYSLKSASSAISESKKPQEWLALADHLIKEFFGNASSQNSRIFSLVNKLKDQAAYTASETAIPFSLFKSWFSGQLVTQNSSSGRFGQGITVSSYIPFRSVPFRYIAVLGMNEGAFPRKAIRPDFDLIYSNPQPGDRILKEDDTYLFFEMLQAAEDHLHLSYIGQDQRSDSFRLPSILIQQLLDVTHDKAEESIIRHSLHPFNKRYFTENKLQSYSDLNRKIAVQIEAEEPDSSSKFLDENLPVEVTNGSDHLSVTDLINFFVNPCKHFLHNELDIRDYSSFNEIIDREQFKLKGLERYQLDEFLFQTMSRNQPVDEVYEYAKSASLIPEGLQGIKAFAREKESVSELRKLLDERLTGEEKSVDITFPIDGRKLVGTIPGIFGDTLVSYRVGARRAKHEIEHWLKHVILFESEIPIQNSLFVSKNGSEVEVLEINSSKIHHNLLSEYVKWFGSTEKTRDSLAFFPESSKAYAASFMQTEAREKALGKAKNEWEPSKFKKFAESTDFYNSLIWREVDPLAAPAFHENALKFWNPFFKAIEEGKA